MRTANATRQTAPQLSVIMPVYNGERFLTEAIDSILAQTICDFEFIIVDDSSTDDSAAIIRDYGQRDGRIRFVQHAVNRGQAAALNTGIAAARADIIALMDCDDISQPRRLQAQVDFLTAHPDIGAVGAQLQEVDLDLKPLADSRFPQRHAEIVLGMYLSKTTLAGSVVAMRADALRAVGGYEEQARNANDKELFLRLAHQTRFANLPDCLYLYRQHGDNMTVVDSDKIWRSWHALYAQWMQRLWQGRPPVRAQRLEPLFAGQKLNWLHRRRMRSDLRRLLDVLVASGCLNNADRVWLEADFARRLQGAMPRAWQMILHWRRYRLGF